MERAEVIREMEKLGMTEEEIALHTGVSEKKVRKILHPEEREPGAWERWFTEEWNKVREAAGRGKEHG